MGTYNIYRCNVSLKTGALTFVTEIPRVIEPVYTAQ